MSKKPEKQHEKREVMVRFILPKDVHAAAMDIHNENPRTMTFADTMAEIVAAGVMTVRSSKNNLK